MLSEEGEKREGGVVMHNVDTHTPDTVCALNTRTQFSQQT